MSYIAESELMGKRQWESTLFSSQNLDYSDNPGTGSFRKFERCNFDVCVLTMGTVNNVCGSLWRFIARVIMDKWKLELKNKMENTEHRGCS